MLSGTSAKGLPTGHPTPGVRSSSVTAKPNPADVCQIDCRSSREEAVVLPCGLDMDRSVQVMDCDFLEHFARKKQSIDVGTGTPDWISPAMDEWRGYVEYMRIDDGKPSKSLAYPVSLSLRSRSSKNSSTTSSITAGGKRIEGCDVGRALMSSRRVLRL
jgi:hypothetical protein